LDHVRHTMSLGWIGLSDKKFTSNFAGFDICLSPLTRPSTVLLGDIAENDSLIAIDVIVIVPWSAGLSVYLPRYDNIR